MRIFLRGCSRVSGDLLLRPEITDCVCTQMLLMHFTEEINVLSTKYHFVNLRHTVNVKKMYVKQLTESLPLENICCGLRCTYEAVVKCAEIFNAK